MRGWCGKRGGCEKPTTTPETKLDALFTREKSSSPDKFRINSLSSLIQESTSLSEIVHLTGTRETSQLQDREERSTRYIETETIQLILGDSTGQIPGAWTEGLEALSKIQSNERSQTKRALRASIPVSKSRLSQTVLDKTEPISEKGLLSQYLFLNAQPFYDSNIGFIIHKD